jgi:hypothetical protein
MHLRLDQCFGILGHHISQRGIIARTKAQSDTVIS